MYFADLELYRYHVGVHDAVNWSAPLRAIGWLEHPHPFSKGTPPGTLIPKLKQLVEQTNSAYPDISFRGLHNCSHCAAASLPSPGLTGSHINIFVPGASVVYVAPAGIVHYIEEHSYLPPSEFLDAVLECPNCSSAEYRAALCEANGRISPPLKVSKPFKKATVIMGTLLDISRERGQRILDGHTVRDDVTYYTIDDGQKYIYVLTQSLRYSDDEELPVTVNAPIKIGIMWEEIDDDCHVIDNSGKWHTLSLQKRSLRPSQ